ncbi:MAG: hypothetical protein J6A44_02200 [Paludibacteraceae bacterium]|nr:hypothetical protein [Paludibacteraceae bacterium]MBO5345700.1 hypothetical protein [Paludibacteraceae bacterium]
MNKFLWGCFCVGGMLFYVDWNITLEEVERVERDRTIGKRIHIVDVYFCAHFLEVCLLAGCCGVVHTVSGYLYVILS